MDKMLTAATLLLFACATCFGQSTYKGLTPGQSTKTDVERVLGPPVKEHSETLSNTARNLWLARFSCSTARVRL